MAESMEIMDEAFAESLACEEQNGRLLDLVGELLHSNQRLRYRVTALEHQLKRTERALESASAVLPLMLP